MFFQLLLFTGFRKTFGYTLLERYGIEIGGGLGPLAGKIWRVGLMGHTARKENVDRLLGALRQILA